MRDILPHLILLLMEISEALLK